MTKQISNGSVGIKHGITKQERFQNKEFKKEDICRTKAENKTENFTYVVPGMPLGRKGHQNKERRLESTLSRLDFKGKHRTVKEQ